MAELENTTLNGYLKICNYGVRTEAISFPTTFNTLTPVLLFQILTDVVVFPLTVQVQFSRLSATSIPHIVALYSSEINMQATGLVLPPNHYRTDSINESTCVVIGHPTNMVNPYLADISWEFWRQGHTEFTGPIGQRPQAINHNYMYTYTTQVNVSPMFVGSGSINLYVYAEEAEGFISIIWAEPPVAVIRPLFL